MSASDAVMLETMVSESMHSLRPLEIGKVISVEMVVAEVCDLLYIICLLRT